jgi:FMN-dependent NADH-azoreductase
MKLMHVDSSPKGDRSTSRTLAREFIELLQAGIPELEVDYLDLAADPPGHVTGEFAVATYTPEAERTPGMKATLATSDAICARVLAADLLVFAMPMYNFSIPSNFKAFIDMLVRAEITYKAIDGQYVGQLGDKKVAFITSRGVDLRPGTPWGHMDALTPALSAAFGFLGVTKPQFVDAQPMQFAAPEARAEGLVRAHEDVAALAADWLGAT